MEDDGYFYIDYYKNKTKVGCSRIWTGDFFKFKVGDCVCYKSSLKDGEYWYARIICFIHCYDGSMGIIGHWTRNKEEAYNFDYKIDFSKYVRDGHNLVDKRWHTEKASGRKDNLLECLGHMGLDYAIKLDHTINNERGIFMNKLIVNHFPKTEDAVLIEKWFGGELANNHLMSVMLKGKEQELIEEAKKLENEEKATKKVKE